MKKGLLKVKILVEGKSVNYLPELLRRKGVTAHKVKKLKDFSSIFTVDYNDLRKFFAICKNMCYNTKVKGYSGLLCPIAYALKNLALTLGIILFSLTLIVLDGYVFGIKCVGNGAKYSNELIKTLNGYGVDKGVKFSSLNYTELSNAILKSNDNIKFASVYKRGNTLIINAEVGSGSVIATAPKTTDLVCDVEGVVESVKALRGTASVSEGDTVSNGSVLIGAYSVLGEERYPSAVLGVVTVLTEEKYFFKTDVFSTSLMQASMQTAEFLTSLEVVDKKCTAVSGGYEVILTVRKRFSGG